MGCNTIGKNKQTSEDFSCPRVFFSSEDRVFIDTAEGGTSIDDITYKAELNNFAFIDKCLQQNEAAVIPLDILIIAQPMEVLKNGDVSIPFMLSYWMKMIKYWTLNTLWFLNQLKKNLKQKILLKRISQIDYT